MKKKNATSHHSASHVQSTLALVGASVFCCSLLMFRIVLSGVWTFDYLIWNLFLAWVPFFVSLGMSLKANSLVKKPLLLVLAASLWLLFFPNAPYIVTDFIHLFPRRGIPLWFDVMLMSSFAITGFVIGLYSLLHMHELAEAWVGKKLSWLLLTLTIYLTGLGIYLGRVLRWNSWDILVSPKLLFQDVLHVLNPVQQPKLVVISGFFFLFLLWTYLPFYSAVQKRKTGRNA